MRAQTGAGLGAALPQHARAAVGWWLFGSAAAVLVMVGVGGVTRLTRSGLSMTEWKFTGERWPSSQACRVVYCLLDPQRSDIFDSSREAAMPCEAWPWIDSPGEKASRHLSLAWLSALVYLLLAGLESQIFEDMRLAFRKSGMRSLPNTRRRPSTSA